MSLPYLLALSHFRKIGPARYHKLTQLLGDPENVWRATREHLLHANLGHRITEEFLAWRRKVDPQSLIDDIARRGILVTTADSPRYPELLHQLSDPPYILYHRGELPPADATCVSIVGSREPTAYGKNVARDLAHDLASAGAIIISGLAQGIDQEAHSGALEVHGRTIAVLGSGLDAIDSSYKETFTGEILKYGGAVVAEYPPDMGAQPWMFPVRNRIISGFSKATVIVEAAIPSGSLTTAQSALEQNRQVFAVPGPIHSPTSKGTNQLLRQGAHVATCAQDVLDDLSSGLSVAPSSLQLTDEEAAIYKLVLNTPQHIDDITRQSPLPTHHVTGMLAMLEMRGVIRNLGGMRYIR